MQCRHILCRRVTGLFAAHGGGPGRFLYFELDPSDWPSPETVFEEEVQLAGCINHAVAILRMPQPHVGNDLMPVDLDDVFVDESRLEDPEAIYDAIADLLLLAHARSWNLQDICDQALGLGNRS
jgi:hypothetical protein